MYDNDRHYCAGLFDGEGWFSISKSKRKDTSVPVSFQCRASLALTDEEPVRWLQEIWGGCVVVKRGRKVTHKDCYTWVVTGENAMKFAESVGPLLRIKKDQASVLCSFQRNKNNRTNKYSSLSLEEHLIQKAHFLQMTELNKKGP